MRRHMTRSIAYASVGVICTTLSLPSAFAADFPIGLYKVDGIQLSFDDKGQFQVNKGSMLEVSGTYAVKEGEIELTDVQGPWACAAAGKQKGVYKWSFGNAALTFSKITDRCENRTKSLVGAPWALQR